jgi:GT2 family glycosyltransferase/glycosyltransferase involved in cell wall biosynthesis/SAM-dependent methyltransferase
MAEAHQPEKENSVPDYAGPYGAEYYRTGFGAAPYDRSTPHWLEFFGGIAAEIIRSLKPRNVFDAGCAWGFLVEAFWDRGVEAGGVDVSEYAIAHLRPDMRPYCRVGSLTDPIEREYDLVTCIEVLEHMPGDEVDRAIANLCRATNRILFSSTPGDFDEPTHFSVRPVMGWLRAFQTHGFVPDLLYDASFVSPHAFLLRRQTEPMPEETLALFQVKVQSRVEVVDKLVRLIQAAKDIQALRTRSEEAERERDQWQHKAEERGYTIEEWICHDNDLRREMRRAEDEATRCLHEASGQLETALRNLSETKQEAFAQAHDFSYRLETAAGELRDLAGRLDAVHAEKDAVHAEKDAVVSQMGSQIQDLSDRLTELYARHGEVEQLARHIEAEYASPAWQLIKRYRSAMNNARSRHPLVRKVVEPAVVKVLRALGAGPKAVPAPAAPEAPGPGPAVGSSAAPAAPATTTSPDPALYAEWIRKNEPDAAGLADQARIASEFAYRPRISIVTPVYKVPLDVVREAILSVQAQTYDNWELCLTHACPDAQDVRQYLESASQSDPRIKVALLTGNLGISGNSNAAFALASGEFIALLDHDDALAPFALFEVVRAINDDPSVDFLYSDKDQLTADATGARRVSPLFKPRWSPEIMLSANYVTHLNVMRTEHVQAIGGWRKETDGAQDWDLFFRVIARSQRIRHIPKVLYHWRQIATSVAGGGMDAKPYAARAQFVTLRDYCQTQGWNVELQEPDAEGAIRLKWKTDRKVSIIYIPSSAATEAISGAEALLATVGSVTVEILIPLAGDAASALSKDTRVKLVKVSPNTSQAERITQAVNQSEGTLLVFFDQSVTPAGPDWLQELTGPLQNPEVGLVGAKLLDPRNESIRHAGIVFAQDGRPQYIFSGEPEYYYEVFGGPGWFRNWTAVSGACAAMRREVWDQTGGFSGEIRYPRLDIELCLRAQLQLGLRVVYNPHARLFQGAPSGMEAWLNTEGENAGAGYIGASFPDGDPYFNPNLNCRKGVVRVGRPTKDAASLDYAAESRILVTAFDFTRAQLNESRRGTQGAGKRRLEQITWFLPEFANPFYGGVHTILRFAAYFAEQHAVGSRFVILGQAHPRAMLRRITAAFPGLDESDVRVMNSDAQIDDLPASDAAMATLWTTAYSLLKFRHTRRKFYFIQDHEPLFYPAGSTSALVDATYDFGFTGICNTISLKEIYEAQGGKAEYFDPSIDSSIFYRNGRERGNRKPYLVFCYARPGHPRNCFELLMEALKRLKQRLGEDISIVTAGADWSPAAYGVEGVIRNLGMLGYRETGALYRACDAGVVAMKTRHPSYLPLELMACGAAVVTNRNPYTGWLLRDGENCILAETSPSALAESLEEVLRDTALRARLAATSAEVVGRYSDWSAQAEKIYQFMVAEC